MQLHSGGLTDVDHERSCLRGFRTGGAELGPGASFRVGFRDLRSSESYHRTQGLHDDGQVQRIVGQLLDAVIDPRYSHGSVLLSLVSAKVVRT